MRTTISGILELQLYRLSDIRIPKITNARSGQASWYVSEQNVLSHENIDDLVDDLDKNEAECFWSVIVVAIGQQNLFFKIHTTNFIYKLNSCFLILRTQEKLKEFLK